MYGTFNTVMFNNFRTVRLIETVLIIETIEYVATIVKKWGEPYIDCRNFEYVDKSLHTYFQEMEVKPKIISSELLHT